jgi:hypothetical protein
MSSSVSLPQRSRADPVKLFPLAFDLVPVLYALSFCAISRPCSLHMDYPLKLAANPATITNHALREAFGSPLALSHARQGGLRDRSAELARQVGE